MGKGSALRRLAWEVVLADVGEPPWVCEWSGCELGTIQRRGNRRLEGCIHHVDETLENFARDNLVLGHQACHTRHHGPMIILKALAAREQHRRDDPAFDAKFRADAAERGRRNAQKTNAKRFRCACGMVTSPGPLGMHQRATGHVGRVRA